MPKVAERLSKSLPLIKRWSIDHHWPARIAAYDRHLDQQSVEAEVKARQDMIILHAATARRMMTLVAQRLTQLNPKELSPSDLVRMMDAASKLERLSRGEPTEHVEQSGTVNALTSPAARLMVDDEDLAARAEELAIEANRRFLEREARSETDER